MLCVTEDRTVDARRFRSVWLLSAGHPVGYAQLITEHGSSSITEIEVRNRGLGRGFVCLIRDNLAGGEIDIQGPFTRLGRTFAQRLEAEGVATVSNCIPEDVLEGLTFVSDWDRMETFREA